MRVLEKMVLINSANMKCEEIQLDGNVHFIGLNGTGKSTLLRAVLFFYNATTTQLGIEEKAGHKKFIDFYLPTDKSYMIYQVKTNTGPFMVVAYNRQKRIHFRFIDTAYERSYFLDENNRALMDWSKIAERIGDKSLVYNSVRTFEEYRNIIYGRGGVDKRLSRFRLFDKGVGHSMPQIIQDVYLNNTLEADDIKKTIIGSSNNESMVIELDRWRGLLSQLKNKITDVNLWCRKEKDGSVRVRTDAEKLVEALTAYRNNLFNKRMYCGMVGYTLKREKERVPLMEIQMKQLATDMERATRLLEEEEKKYLKERDGLVGEKKSLENKLKETEAKRKIYELRDMGSVLKRMAEEQKLCDNKDLLTSRYNVLTDKSKDIRHKYDEMLKGLDDESKRMLFRKDNRCLGLEKEYNDSVKNLHEVFQNQSEELRQEQAQCRENFQKDWKVLNERLADVKIQMAVSRNQCPQLEQIAQLETEIQTKEQKIKEFAGQKENIVRAMDKIIHEFDLKVKDKEYRVDKIETKLENRKKELYARLKEIETLLDSWDGSFMNWLEENVPGWENNIGRTVLEENVLYNKNLSPKWVGDSQTLFGVEIDCGRLTRQVRTPRDLKNEREGYERELAMVEQQQLQERSRLDEELKTEREIHRSSLKKMEKEWTVIEQNYVGFSSNVRTLKERVRTLKTEAEEWMKNRMAELQLVQNSIEQEMLVSQNKWEETDSKAKKDIKNLETKYRKAVESALAEKIKGINVLEQEYAEEKIRVDNERKQLQKDMTEELVKDGVDERILKDLQSQIWETVKELQWIDSQRKFYYDYLKDKEDYFDRVDVWKMELDRLKKSLNSLEQKYKERADKKKEEKERCAQEYGKLKTDLERMKVDIDKVEQYLVSGHCPQEYSSDNIIPTEDTLSSVFENLRKSIEAEMGLKDNLKGTAVRFKRHFSESNTFDFQTNLETDGEYLRLATQVDEFLKGNVIETFKVQVRDFSLGMFGNLCQEVSSLNERIGDVKKLVNKINTDFRENQFTDVISLVEMRVEESSSNRLMRQLNSLADFFENNRFFMEKNLFADEKTVREVNERLIAKLSVFLDELNTNSHLRTLTLAQAFELTFRVTENGNMSPWLNRLKGWGSEGTGIMVKAMINIVLLNIHRNKERSGETDDWVHCIMDEIGMIHSKYVKGLIHFANHRKILLVNGSPEQQGCGLYKRTYLVQKDKRNVTIADLLLERIK